MTTEYRKLKAVAALVFLVFAGVTFASAQVAGAARTASSAAPPQTAEELKEIARLKTFIDKNGGYRDSYGGYYDPRAGTYTDDKGGVLDNWQGYTYKDGSYKSKFGDYWDAPTKTFKLSNGEVMKSPGTSNEDAITVLRETVAEHGGYDKDFLGKAMLGQIQKDHPLVPNKAAKPEPAPAVSAEEARLLKYLNKDGGYMDRLGGYSDSKAGTYTDKEGGVVDNWKGYTYKDGSYKSGLGDYWDAKTKTFHLTDGRVAARAGLSNADAIKAMRQNVEANGGYDKDFIRRSMMASIAKEHPQR